jgi:hypothetical protein
MNTHSQPFLDARALRIVVIAVAAATLLVIAAYLFGTGLQADTGRSVAASPLGSSLTAIRESRLDDYYGRYSNLASAVKITALAGSRLDDYFARLNSPAPADSRLDDYFGRLSQRSAASP